MALMVVLKHFFCLIRELMSCNCLDLNGNSWFSPIHFCLNPYSPQCGFGAGFEFACIKWAVDDRLTPFKVCNIHKH